MKAILTIYSMHLNQQNILAQKVNCKPCLLHFLHVYSLDIYNWQEWHIPSTVITELKLYPTETSLSNLCMLEKIIYIYYDRLPDILHLDIILIMQPSMILHAHEHVCMYVIGKICNCEVKETRIRLIKFSQTSQAGICSWYYLH